MYKHIAILTQVIQASKGITLLGIFILWGIELTDRVNSLCAKCVSSPSCVHVPPANKRIEVRSRKEFTLHSVGP